MSLKVALWCPHGRDGLPLAARLLLQQFPPDLVAWASDLADPPAAEESLTWDLALVLCASVPPPRPAWLASRSRAGAILPGTTPTWDDATRAALEGWAGWTVLTDLLPDETSNRTLDQWHRDGLALAWLPALPHAYQNPAGANSWEVVDLSAGSSERESLRLARRSVVLSDDPVISGVAARVAAETGSTVGVLGSAGSIARHVLLGGVVADHLSFGSIPPPGVSPVRALTRAVTAAPLREKGNTPEFTWLDWCEALARPHELAATTGGITAQFLEANRRKRADRGWEQPPGAPAVLDRKYPFVLYPTLVLHPAAIKGLAACSPEGWWYAYVGQIVDNRRDWLDTALKRLATEPDAGLARLLWCAVCDGLWRRATHAVSEAVGRAFEASLLLPERGGSDWGLGRLIVLAASGRFEAADEEASSLKATPGSLVEYLRWVLRAWSPALEAGEMDMLPVGAGAWWLRQARACVDLQHPEAAMLFARGQIMLGDSAAGTEMAAQCGSDDRASIVLNAWMRGDRTLVRLMGEPILSLALPSSPEGRLRLLVVRALLSRDPALVGDLRALVATSPQLFLPERPSHDRATLLAGGFRLAGALDDAAAWTKQACAQDPMATLRLARLLKG